MDNALKRRILLINEYDILIMKNFIILCNFNKYLNMIYFLHAYFYGR